MKKITKTNFQGLRQLFPVLEKEEMRHYVGGTFGGYYYTGGWNSDGGYYGSPGSGDSSYYSQYDFDNWEGPWYGGWVYGMGWVAPDADIYGHKPGGGSSNTHEYPYWWYYDEPFEHPDWDGNYGGYYYNGSFDDGNLNLIHLNNGECVVAAIVNAGIMLGVDLSVSSITSDLKSYKDNSINRYVISDELLGNILDDYFDVTIVDKVSRINKYVVLGKPVCIRLNRQENTVDGITYQQLHDVVITGVNNGMNGYFEYYDSVTGEMGHMTQSELETKTTGKFYILDHK